MVRTKPPRAAVKCWFNTTGSVLPGLLNSPGLPWEDSPGSRFFPTGHYHLPGGELRPASSNKAEHRIRNPKVWVGVLAPLVSACVMPTKPFHLPSQFHITKSRLSTFTLPTSRRGTRPRVYSTDLTLEQGQGFSKLWSMEPCLSLEEAEIWRAVRS